jgi:hypothetical protein
MAVNPGRNKEVGFCNHSAGRRHAGAPIVAFIVAHMAVQRACALAGIILFSLA